MFPVYKPPATLLHFYYNALKELRRYDNRGDGEGRAGGVRANGERREADGVRPGGGKERGWCGEACWGEERLPDIKVQAQVNP